MTAHDATPAPSQPPVPVAVQILTTIFYAGFAISVSIVAMALFGVIGIVLAVLFAWQWGRMRALGGTTPVTLPALPQRAAPASTGNASFDSYRDEVLARLEEEQSSFEAFLIRLREAKDKTEFDAFMTQRASVTPVDSRPINGRLVREAA